MSSPIIELQNVTKTYYMGENTLDALKGVSLKVHEGEVVAIVGPSGSGKSTLMNMIGLLDHPTTGEYLIDGRKVETLNDTERAQLRNKKIGFIFQSFHLLLRQTALQNVMLPLHYRGLPKHEAKEMALAMLDNVDMKAHAYHKPTELSGGQQQRAATARALVGKPSLILADEPTGALDTKTGDSIMNLFLDLNKKENITIVIITHDPSIAARCHRSIHIKDGLIDKDGH